MCRALQCHRLSGGVRCGLQALLTPALFHTEANTRRADLLGTNLTDTEHHCSSELKDMTLLNVSHVGVEGSKTEGERKAASLFSLLAALQRLL